MTQRTENLLALTLAVLIFFPATAAQASIQVRPVPDAITRYIEARNCAAAFSTPRERAGLLSLSSLEDVRDSIQSKRLIAVWRHLQRVKSAEMEVGSDINMLWDKRQVNPVPPELLRIQNAERRDKNTLVVRALVYRLGWTENQKLISAYDQETGSGIPETKVPDEFFTRDGKPVVQRWTKAEGRWKKKSADLRYLEMER
jgi:hypothetical protein